MIIMMKMNRSIRHFGTVMLWLMLSATHLSSQPFNGGEITWECNHLGRYRFKLVIYRECGAVTMLPIQTLSTNIPGLDTFSVTRISSTDLSPFCSCPGIAPLSCATTTIGTVNTGAMEVYVYTTDGFYPQGIQMPNALPPPGGWYIGFSDGTQRPPSTNQSASYLYFLRSLMFNYNNNVNPCLDHTPVFSELPHFVVCTGAPASLNFGATDREHDSLTYEWAPGIVDPQGPSMIYLNGYSYNSPLPGPAQNPNNIPATLNPQTGMVSFTSFTPGTFWLVVKVTAYKCGIKVAEIYREAEVVLVSCGTNSVPDVTPPFPNANGQYVLYNDTVTAGMPVNFMISATDFNYCPGAAPPTAQVIRLYASGNMFDSLINPFGCINPPCATLTPSPTPTTPLYGQFGVQTYFNWQTTCNHLHTNNGCGSTTNQYTFLFKVIDNFCPVPAFRYVPVSIFVNEYPSLPSPVLIGTGLLPGGDVKIKWKAVTDTLGSFLKYYIWYHAGGVISPFTILDSLTNVTDSEYVHINAYHNANYLQYFVTTRSLCYNISQPQDTITATSIGLEDIAPDNRFAIGIPVPNPTSHLTSVPYHLPQSGEISVTLTDLAGKTLLHESFNAPSGDNNFTINLLPYPKGVYILTFRFNGEKLQTVVTKL